jgi:hypothetical protein
MPGRRKNPKEEGPRSSHSGRGGIGALKIKIKTRAQRNPKEWAALEELNRLQPAWDLLGPMQERIVGVIVTST